MGTLALGTWIAFMGATVGGTVCPGSQRLAAPILCPERKTPPAVVVTTSNPSPGRTAFSAQLICFTDRGEPESPGPLLALGVLFAIYWLPALALSAGAILAIAARRKGRARETSR
jgi:hypothetical protein